MSRAQQFINPLMGISEINRVCPAITPSLGSELFANPGFDADTDWGKGGVWTIAAGVASIAGAQGNISQDVLTAGNWYQEQFSITAYVAGFFTLLIGSTNQSDALSSISTLTTTERATNATGGVRSVAVTGEGSIDNVSAKQITFSSMLAPLGSRSKRPGTYTCTPTVTNSTQAGLLLAYANASNFVQLIVNRAGTDQAQLIKCIAGTYTSVIAGAITYGAAKALKVIVAANGTDYSLYYDDAQIGATTAINDAGLGTKVHGFNTYSGNQVGTVTTSGATS